MGAFPRKLIDATDPKYKAPAGTSYTFEYTPCDASRWKQDWKRSKKRFETIDDAVRASGLWMQTCFDNDWPIAVRLVEM